MSHVATPSEIVLQSRALLNFFNNEKVELRLHTANIWLLILIWSFFASWSCVGRSCRYEPAPCYTEENRDIPLHPITPNELDGSHKPVIQSRLLATIDDKSSDDHLPICLCDASIYLLWSDVQVDLKESRSCQKNRRSNRCLFFSHNDCRPDSDYFLPLQFGGLLKCARTVFQPAWSVRGGYSDPV